MTIAINMRMNRNIVSSKHDLKKNKHNCYLLPTFEIRCIAFGKNINILLKKQICHFHLQ